MNTELLITTPRAGTVSVTSGSVTLTGTGTDFSAADVGKQIIIRTTAGDKRGVIATFTNALSVDLAVAIDTTQSGCYFYVDYYSMDLTEDFPYSLNYSIADIREPDKRNSSFSKTITIPGTKANNIIFDNIFEVDHEGSFNPNIRAFAIVYSAFVPVFVGNLQLLKINRDSLLNKITYECSIFGKIGDLFQKVADKLLTDLDLSWLDEYGTNAEIQATWAGGGDLFYPILNNGLQLFETATPAYLSDQVAPAIKVSHIFENILSSVGYTCADTASLYAATGMDKLYVPCLKEWRRRVYIDFGIRVKYTALGFAGNLSLVIERTRTGTIDTFFIGVVGDTAYTNLTYQTTIELDYGDVLYFQVEGDSANLGASNLVENVGIHSFLKITYLDTEFNYNTNGYNDLALVADITQVGAGGAGTLKKIKFDLETSDVNNTWTTNDRHTVPLKHTQGFLPDNYKQRDFLNALIKMFNLYLEPVFDNDTQINILPRDTYYSQGTEIDWTAKFDIGQNVELVPMGELDWKEYLFSWKDETDFYNKDYKGKTFKTYGQRNVIVENDFITNKKSIIPEVAPMPLTGSNYHTIVVPASIKEGVTSTNNAYSGNLRIIYYDAKMVAGAFKLDSVSEANYPFSGHLIGDDPQTPTFDYNWAAPLYLYYTLNNPSGYPNSDNLYTAFWQNFIEEISDKYSKLLIAYFNLTAEDIRTLDFRNSFFINGTYYRLNKVIDYSPIGDRLTKCELIRMRDAVNIGQSAVVSHGDTAVGTANDNPLPLVSSELASGEILVGNADGLATDVPMSGDATIDNTGRVINVALQGNAVKDAAPANNNVLTWVTANNRWEPVAPSGGGTPGGANKQVQYNDGGAFGAEAGFEYDKTTNELTVPDIIDSSLTASELIAANGSKKIVSLAVATYPSLVELTYVKGVTSAIQTQMNLKAPLASPALTGTPTAPTQAANDNSTKIATTAYADAKVSDAIADTVTTIAPSQNAVFDALALKQRSIVLDKLTSGGGSGTATSETKIYTYTIPANTFASGDFIHFLEKFTKSATNGNVTIRVRWSTTDAVAGTIIATYTGTSATRVIALERVTGNFSSSTNLNIYSGSTSLNYDVNFDSATTTAVTVDLTIVNYLVVTYQNGSASDTTTHVLSLTERK